jgi:hypothetical protein
MGPFSQPFVPSSSWSRRLATVIVTFTIVCMLGALAPAQTAATKILGTITDAQKAAIVKAKVTATNVATSAVRSTETDGSGNYEFPALEPGSYVIQAEMKGFSTVRSDAIQALVNTATRLNLTLPVGAVNEVVEVQGTAQSVNTVDATVGNAFTAQQIQSLPLEARNVVNLLSLQPGATFLPNSGTNTGASTANNDPRNGSVNGAHSDSRT